MHMKKNWLFLLLIAACSLRAETINVEYGGKVNLDGFNCSYVNSSLVDRVCYRQNDSYLILALRGTYYQFCEVPSYIHQGLISASSHGRFFNENIRGQYNCGRRN